MRLVGLDPFAVVNPFVVLPGLAELVLVLLLRRGLRSARLLVTLFATRYLFLDGVHTARALAYLRGFGGGGWADVLLDLVLVAVVVLLWSRSSRRWFARRAAADTPGRGGRAGYTRRRP